MAFRRLLGKRLWPFMAVGAAAWYVRAVHRYRDPVRVPAAEGGVILCPADGVVSFVRRVTDGQVNAEALSTRVNIQDLLGGDLAGAQDGWLLGIFLGPLDVHYVYQPLSGEIAQVAHTGSRVNVPLLSAAETAAFLAGRPVDLLGRRGTLENERLSWLTRGEPGNVTVTLVAPAAGLHATSYLRQGDTGRAGYKAAFLAEGGLVMLFLPEPLTPQVSVGDRVEGAQTVMAGE